MNMGCFNVACSISNISINAGTEIAYIPLQVSKYPYKIGDGNAFLIYIHCFYSPVTLPIFGEYDDYGGIENIKRDGNAVHIEKYFKTNIKNVIEGVKPISSGMFVHKKIYDLLVNTSIDEWGKSRGDFVYTKYKLSKVYDEYRKKVLKEMDTWENFNKFVKGRFEKSGIKDPEKEIDFTLNYMAWESNGGIFSFREYEEFKKIYRPCILKGGMKNRIIEFSLFELGMAGLNTFYFPAANGYQHGNQYLSEIFYKKCHEIMVKEIKERERE